MKIDGIIASIVRKFYTRYWEPFRPKPQPESLFTAQNAKYANYDIGEWTYGSPLIMHDDGMLKVGKFCSIARDVVILLGGEHHKHWVTTYPFYQIFGEAEHYPGWPMTKGDVVIGNDVWIGHGACVLSGVRIGDGAVVGARSVVTRDVEPYAVVAGTPARLVRYRFPEATIQALLDIAWWDWPLPAIKDAWPLLLSDRIDDFVARYGKNASAAGVECRKRVGAR